MDSLARITVDRSSPVPMYHQVSQAIEAGIRDGSIAVGSWLESEVDLAKKLGLSRPTMRRAIGELVNSGLLVRQRGVGTRVVSSYISRPVELTSLFDDLVKSGAHPFTKVLSLTTTPHPLDMPESAELTGPVWHVERLRGTTETGPVGIMTNWVPTTYTLSTEGLEESGLYGLLRQQNADIRIAHQTIGAHNATARQAQLLNITKGSACISMQRITRSGKGEIIEVGSHLYRGDIYTYTQTVAAK